MLDGAGVACGRLNLADEFIRHPQHEARKRWRDVDSPVGPIRALLPPPVSPGWTPRMDRIPALGQDTRKILSELGRTDHQIDQLIKDNIVGVPLLGAVEARNQMT